MRGIRMIGEPSALSTNGKRTVVITAHKFLVEHIDGHATAMTYACMQVEALLVDVYVTVNPFSF